MLENERQIKIIEILEKEKKVTVNDLVKTLFVSPATIRRDLSEMASRGLLKRIHGGAILYASSSQESSILIRENSNKDEK
ncbi:MAG: DeoR family transcriptional regulator, partial [Bacilli bacterium]|nr:DeoR family transcriptional regulator [Bacilli bacterium]